MPGHIKIFQALCAIILAVLVQNIRGSFKIRKCCGLHEQFLEKTRTCVESKRYKRQHDMYLTEDKPFTKKVAYNLSDPSKHFLRIDILIYGIKRRLKISASVQYCFRTTWLSTVVVSFKFDNIFESHKRLSEGVSTRCRGDGRRGAAL